jgi:putative transposase
MNRGNNRQMIFTDKDEKSYFLYLLHEKKQENEVQIYHYCIMGNHFHLVVRAASKADLSRFLKRAFVAYYRFFKNHHEYAGHLFQGRFKSIIIDTQSYLIQCGKYIETNPVRANLVSDPSEYAHSSYRFYADGAHDPLITPNPLYPGLGATEAERQAAYRKLIINGKVVNSAALRSKLYLGSDEFIKKMEMQFGIRNIGFRTGRPKRKKSETSPFIDKKR